MLPERFLNWAYEKRAKLVKRQIESENIHPRDIFLGFTTHTPAIITNGSAGLNGSIKGIGFLPKRECIEEILDIYMAHIATTDQPGYSERGLKILYERIYNTHAREHIDFGILGTLEMAKSHTWTNLNENPHATLLFYEPPAISFEARTTAEIHADGIYHKFINAQHDMYHRPNTNSWMDKPAYIFRIEKIFDNSVSKDGFGTMIFP